MFRRPAAGSAGGRFLRGSADQIVIPDRLFPSQVIDEGPDGRVEARGQQQIRPGRRHDPCQRVIDCVVERWSEVVSRVGSGGHSRMTRSWGLPSSPYSGPSPTPGPAPNPNPRPEPWSLFPGVPWLEYRGTIRGTPVPVPWSMRGTQSPSTLPAGGAGPSPGGWV